MTVHQARGLKLNDIRQLLLSHIHLDHAGAAGAIVREHPAIQVHVSAVGAPHLTDPSRLESGARRRYGDTFDRLWGELVPVPVENIRIAGDDVVGLECFPSTGHASHPVSMLHEDGTLYAGDSAGVRIAPARFVHAPTPPPDIDLEAWRASTDTIVSWNPDTLFLTHFGPRRSPRVHFQALWQQMDAWSARVRASLAHDHADDAARAEVGRCRVENNRRTGNECLQSLRCCGL